MEKNNEKTTRRHKQECKEYKDKEVQAFSLPSEDEIEDSSKPKLKTDLQKICDKLYEKKIFPKVHAFKNKMVKEHKNERAILHTLVRCYMKKDFEDGNPWAYCTKIINVEDGNFSEREFRKSE